MSELAHHADPGPRPNMEDAFAAATTEVVAPIARHIRVAALCDGVGGNNAGEIASNLASSNLVSSVMAKLLILARPSPQASTPPDAILAALQDALASVNELICRNSRECQGLAAMATTAVCILIVENILFLAWAGDSRAYLFRDGIIRRLTRDHSYVQKLIDAGQLTLEEAPYHPAAHQITQYLGNEGGFQSEIQLLRLVEDDRILVCTDGISDVLSDEQIEHLLCDLLRRGCPTSHWPELLVQEALNSHTHDNASVMIYRHSQVTVPSGNLPTRTAHYPQNLFPILSLSRS